MREILLRAFVIDTVLSLCRPSLSLSLPLSPLLCSPLLPLVSHSVPVVPPLHLPAGSEWKREENPLWIGVALFSSAFLLFGPLGSVVYWCSSGMARVEGCGGGGGGGGSVPLSQSKRFENKCGERKWIWKKKEGEGVAGLWKAREIQKKKEERDEEAVFWRVCGEHRSPLDSARVVFDPNFSHFVKRHFVKVRLGALSMSELGRAGNRLEAALTRQQQSVRTGMYIYTPTHTHTRTSIQAHTHTHTQRCTFDNSALPFRSSPARVKSNFLSISLAPLPPISPYLPSFSPSPIFFNILSLSACSPFCVVHAALAGFEWAFMYTTP